MLIFWLARHGDVFSLKTMGVLLNPFSHSLKTPPPLLVAHPSFTYLSLPIALGPDSQTTPGSWETPVSTEKDISSAMPQGSVGLDAGTKHTSVPHEDHWTLPEAARGLPAVGDSAEVQSLGFLPFFFNWVNVLF